MMESGGGWGVEVDLEGQKWGGGRGCRKKKKKMEKKKGERKEKKRRKRKRKEVMVVIGPRETPKMKEVCWRWSGNRDSLEENKRV